MERARVGALAIGAVSFLAGAGLQVSGYTNEGLALWLLISSSGFGAFFLRPEWGTMRFRLRSPFAIASGATTAGSDYHNAIATMSLATGATGDQPVHRLKKERDDLELDRDRYRLESRLRFEALRYGRRVETYPPLDAATAAAIRLRIDEMGNGLNQLTVGVGAMWSQVSNEIDHKHADTALSELRDCVASREVAYQQHAAALYWETSTTEPSTDLRALLVLFLLNYFDMRFATLRLTELAANPADQRSGYEQWRDQEMALFADLQKAVGSTALEPVRAAIRLYFSERRSKIVRIVLPPVELALPLPRYASPKQPPRI